VVVVRRHAVAAIAIEVEAHGSERHSRKCDDLPASLAEHGRQGGGVQRVMLYQPGHGDFAPIHGATLRLPGNLRKQALEPGRRPCRVDQARLISEPPVLVVHEHEGFRSEKAALRHGVLI
jgi:hypothetical protein